MNSRWVLTALHCVVRDTTVPLANITDEILQFNTTARLLLGLRRRRYKM